MGHSLRRPSDRAVPGLRAQVLAPRRALLPRRRALPPLPPPPPTTPPHPPPPPAQPPRAPPAAQASPGPDRHGPTVRLPGGHLVPPRGVPPLGAGSSLVFLSRKWYGRLPPQGLTSKRKMNSAQNTTYPPGASHLGTTGVMCLRRVRPVVPRPCPVDRSAPWLAWGGFSNEVESRGPTASRCQRWKIESSQANRRLRNEW